MTPEQIAQSIVDKFAHYYVPDELAYEITEALVLFGADCAAQERERTRALLESVADHLYNPFEPDNQSPMYTRVRAALE